MPIDLSAKLARARHDTFDGREQEIRLFRDALTASSHPWSVLHLFGPGAVVSADRLNESRAGVVIVVPCTTTHRGLPSHVEIEPEASGLGGDQLREV